jgi:hypothetical protein
LKNTGKPALSEIVRVPRPRETIRVLGIAVLVAAICWYLGANVWHSILLGSAITVAWIAGVAGTAYPEIRDLGWRHGDRAVNKGSRNDVATLAWSLRNAWGYVGRAAEWRMREVARHRLALEGLNLNDPADGPAIERRIGRPVYKVLMRNIQKRRLRRRELLHCLDALDALNPSHYPSPQPRPRRRTRDAIPSRGTTHER